MTVIPVLRAEAGGLRVEANLSNKSRECLKKIHVFLPPATQKKFQKLNSIKVVQVGFLTRICCVCY